MNSKADVFISHAHEDKEEVARPLAETLRQKGLEVWYDDFVLRLGDNLQGVIEEGLTTSRFGVVVISRAFFAKKWPRRELEIFLAREGTSGAKILLPVWHKVTHEEVFNYSPIVAGRFAESTSRGIDFLASKIIEVVAPRNLTADASSSGTRYDPPMSKLFTYGTAISHEQLSRYLNWSVAQTHSAFLTPRVGRLKDYQLVFSTPYGKEAPGRGVSNIEYSPTAYVEGVVFDLAQGVLTDLEQKVKDRYWLVAVEIELRDGSILRCQTFIAKSPQPGLKPHKQFIDYMVQVSKTAGLDPEFIQRLSEYQVLDG